MPFHLKQKLVTFFAGLQVLITMICIIQIMIFIYSNQPQYLNLQNAYQQLQTKYLQLASSLQTSVNLNAQLQQKLQKMRTQNEILKRSQFVNLQHKHYNSEQPQPNLQNIESQKEVKVKRPNKIKRPLRRQLQIETDSKASESLYQCTYQDCHKIYTSTISMNMHIKLKHNGGTKKERQAYAKIIIDAIDRGEQPPLKNITFPPNFLEQFRKTYEYQRKYNM